MVRDDDVRAIALMTGHGEITDETLRATKQSLAKTYIDDVLDGRFAAPDTKEGEAHVREA
jgi:hypothetical protein